MANKDKDVKKESWTFNLVKTMCRNGKWSLYEGEVYHTQVILFTTKNEKFIKSRVSQIMKDHPDTDKGVELLMQHGKGRYQEWHKIKNSRGLARWFFIHDAKTEEGIPVYYIRLHPSKEDFGNVSAKEQSNRLARQLTGIDADGNFIGDE